MDDEDEKDCIPALKNELGLIFSGPNGDYTIKEYRAEYLKLKADDPDYTWCGQFKRK